MYFLGSVTDIPETTFNNMHGKIVDLKTEDAQKLSVNQLNEIGECRELSWISVRRINVQD